MPGDIFGRPGGEFETTPAARVWQALNASFRIGVILGVEVRIYWASLLTPLLAWEAFKVLEWQEALLYSVATSAILFLVIYLHEMGHIAAGWRYRIPSRLITLSPLGGLAHMAARAPSPGADIVVTAAGPAVNLVLWLALTPIWWAVEAHSTSPMANLLVWWAREINERLFLFNLLPFFPMDGGRVLRALLAFRVHPTRAQVIAANLGIAGGAGIIVYALWLGDIWSSIGVLIGVNNILACLQERAAARHGDGPYGEDVERLEPWQEDPEAWKLGSVTQGAEEQRPAKRAWLDALKGLFRRRAGASRDTPLPRERAPRPREARRDEPPPRAPAPPVATGGAGGESPNEQMDRVLRRVSEVGMAGLTDAEREILAEASKRLRR